MTAARDHPEEDILRAAGLEPRVGWRSTNVEIIRSMVALGLDCTIIMWCPSGDRTYEGLPLADRRIADDVPPYSAAITYPEGAIPTAKVRTLIVSRRNSRRCRLRLTRAVPGWACGTSAHQSLGGCGRA
jgi:hypothetical protein